MKLPACLALTRREPQFLSTPAQSDQHPHARVPISSLSNQLHCTQPRPPPPPHRLAGAYHRGPGGSQRPAGSRQTVFSKNCRRVVACSQAPPPGTCSQDSHTHTLAHVDPGEHPVYTQVSTPLTMRAHVRTHTHGPRMSTHGKRHKCSHLKRNTTDPRTPPAHSSHTNTHAQCRYVPDMPAANGASTTTNTNTHGCVRAHTHTHITPKGSKGTALPPAPTPSSSCQKGRNRNAMNQTPSLPPPGQFLETPLPSLSLWVGDSHTRGNKGAKHDIF